MWAKSKWHIYINTELAPIYIYIYIYRTRTQAHGNAFCSSVGWSVGLEIESHEIDSQPEILELHFSQLFVVWHKKCLSFWHSNLHSFKNNFIYKEYICVASVSNISRAIGLHLCGKVDYLSFGGFLTMWRLGTKWMFERPVL